ncbi:ImmA/IrrE family metallo-endopeptidase [Paenibacillus sp. FSL R7-0026]|uniref:ImmA/IrrE family metallo-endopeptidase n=1 Tax=Paenibacillus sp. FSL R7-0026 TaxID=2921668 RepID=UPI0030FB026A
MEAETTVHESDFQKSVQNYAENFFKQNVKSNSLVITDLLEDIVSNLGIDVMYYNFDNTNDQSRPINGIYMRSNDVTKSHKIIINALDDTKTQIFTLAHELFHHLMMEENPVKLRFVLSNEEILERGGDFFAASLLMNERKFTEHFNFLCEINIFEDLIFKLSDIFRVPYVSVVRRLNELHLLDDEYRDYLNFKESELLERRIKVMGYSLYDQPTHKPIFQPYVRLIEYGLANKQLKLLESVKRLNKVNPGRSEELYSEYMELLNGLNDEED